MIGEHCEGSALRKKARKKGLSGCGIQTDIRRLMVLYCRPWHARAGDKAKVVQDPDRQCVRGQVAESVSGMMRLCMLLSEPDGRKVTDIRKGVAVL